MCHSTKPEGSWFESNPGCDILEYRFRINLEYQVRKDRLVVGIVCIALAVWLFLLGDTGDTIAPTITIAILGISMIAISKNR